MILVIVLLNIQRVVSIKVLSTIIAINRIDKSTGECGLVEQSVIWTQKVVPVAYGAVMIDLLDSSKGKLG